MTDTEHHTEHQVTEHSVNSGTEHPSGEDELSPSPALERLEPMTSYVCSTGLSGTLGHGSLWSGGQRPSPEDHLYCCCGAPYMKEVVSDARYRVQFETIAPHQAAEAEARYGHDVWAHLLAAQWESLAWSPVISEKDSERSARLQYDGLRDWAETHEQPIRNVQLARSTVGAWETLNEPERDAEITTER